MMYKQELNLEAMERVTAAGAAHTIVTTLSTLSRNENMLQKAGAKVVTGVVETAATVADAAESAWDRIVRMTVSVFGKIASWF